MSGLTRKKITVRRKGKTFQRSVMVRASDPIAQKRNLAPSVWYKRHGRQLANQFGLGVAQGAATYAGARAGASLFGFGKPNSGSWRPTRERRAAQVIGSATAGYAAYKGSERLGIAIWDRTSHGAKWKRAENDLARLSEDRRAKVIRVIHGVGHAGTVVGALTAWGTHTIAREIGAVMGIARDKERVRRHVQEEVRREGSARVVYSAFKEALYRARKPQRFRQLGSGR